MQIHLNQRISLILPANLQLTRVSIQSLQRIHLHYLDSQSNKELSSSSQLQLPLNKLSVLTKRSDKNFSLKSFPGVMMALSHQAECISHKDYSELSMSIKWLMQAVFLSFGSLTISLCLMASTMEIFKKSEQ